MPAGCPVVAPPPDIDAVAKTLQKSTAVNWFLQRFPHLGAPLRLINPLVDMVDENLARHVGAHSVLRENRQTTAHAALSKLANVPTLKDVFKYGDDMMVTLQKKRGGKDVQVHINDLLDGKLNKTAARYRLTPEMRDALKVRKDIWDDFRFYYNKAGGKLSADEDMFPRSTAGWIDPADGKLHAVDEFDNGLGSRYGGSPLTTTGTITRARALNPDGTVRSATDMHNDGWRYNDPDAVLYQKGPEIAQRTADSMFQQWIARQNYVKKKGDILGKGVKTGVNPAKFGMVGFDSAQTPALAGYYAPPEVVKYVNEMMTTDKKAVIPGVTYLVNESRGAIASMDFGTTGVQLLGALGADTGHLLASVATLGRASKPSNIFGTAVWNSFKSWLSPTNLTRYYATNKDVIDRWASYLGGLKNSEYVSQMLKSDSNSIVARFPGMRRFGRAFEASLDVAKIEYVKSLERIMGKDISEADKEILGSWVRNSTGMTSTARLGVSPRQQDIEATWLFFSPRFTRSLFAMTGTLLKADKSGHEARLALGGMAAAATTVYLTAAAALGQEPDLDPMKNGKFNPDFFTLRMGNNRVGIGGGMRALARLTADSYESAKSDPSRFISPKFRGAESNPFLAFWRSRSAPLTGTLMDIWTGEDFKGHPIEDGNDYASMVMDRTMPFSLQAAMEAKGQADTKAGVALAAGFGLNTSPVSAYQLYDQYLKNIKNADGSRRFPEGANTQNSDTNNFKTFIQHDPQAVHLKDEYDKSRLAQGGQSADIQKVLDQRFQRINAADAQLKQTGDYRMYRSQINAIRSDSRKTLEDMALGQIRSDGDRKIVQSWFDTYNDPRAVDPVTGGINSDGLEGVQEEWKTAHPGQWEHLIEPNESIGETPMETELRTDRKKIADSGWWDTDKQAWDDLKAMLTNYGGKPDPAGLAIDKYKTYAEYVVGKHKEYMEQFASEGVAEPSMAADIAMQRDPLAKGFQKLRTRARLELQYNDPSLVSLLEKWGYNHTSLMEYHLATQLGNQQG